MAKQSGIHQLKGKVGTMSYYRQKGVETGLVRGINQGLSERVKTDDAYINTRLNNGEFANANAIASYAFNSVNNRQRGMLVNFAVARMTKRALADIKIGTGNWGFRHPATELDVLITDMLENYAKSGKYSGEYGVLGVEKLTIDDVNLKATISAERIVELQSLGIDGVDFVVSKCLAGEIDHNGVPYLYAGRKVESLFTMAFATPAAAINAESSVDFSANTEVGMSVNGYSYAISDTKHGFFVVITMLPYRMVNSQKYTLQEYCTFAALPIGQFAQP